MEQAVVDEWHTVTLSKAVISDVRSNVEEEFDKMLRRDRLVVSEQEIGVAGLEAKRTQRLDGIIDKEDFVERQGQMDRELRQARTVIAGASRIHETLRDRVEVNLRLLRRAGGFYELLPDVGRPTLNQVRYHALYLDIDEDEDGDVFVAAPELTGVADAVEAVTEDVQRATGGAKHDELSGNGTHDPQRTREAHRRRSGLRAGSRHAQDVAPRRRRQRWAGTKKIARPRGDRCSNLTNLAERGGFEPPGP
ncbi:hypothetical protein PO878_21425 [Iamia majanohamensis]|uniref:Uncharacterized protein n=1 Tax=Iamia majanohamensis TaxID=467976 RepID=A0AAE9Y5E2_9ACTN|nr:hypothetical protein [Iamia majanohamensis]WCO67055.1 hypothetical protein PO878_21425 [Iamia majanohamensis]